MPKKQKSHTLTFSRKNKDIENLIARKGEDKSFILTDYICEAIRFFEEYKDKVNQNSNSSININSIIDLIDSRLNERLKEGNIRIENSKLSLKEELEQDLEKRYLDDD
ncbi:hypothetical protein JJB67_16900 [Clostridium perfringens]|uniref:hypothetical protein n=1 Tax=Clostridium perfringens TaxID=1502 RepID=UPI001ABA63A6|nr:hypothetical protein [Clostridium perfringens]MBO3323663.1 hypothetical protein [Clostridium perfringens]MBO3333091.1 hypothetical protein [Clostridium perfringens]MCX0386740.1 hypothetical protein [Clostridium perfringens]